MYNCKQFFSTSCKTGRKQQEGGSLKQTVTTSEKVLRISVSQISVKFTSPLLAESNSSKREGVSILQTSSTPSDTVSLHTKGPDGASNTAHCKQKPEACIKLHHRERISCPLSAFYQLTAGLAFYSKFSILSFSYCRFFFAKDSKLQTFLCKTC